MLGGVHSGYRAILSLWNPVLDIPGDSCLVAASSARWCLSWRYVPIHRTAHTCMLMSRRVIVLALESAEGRPSKVDSILSNIILAVTIVVTIVAMQ